MDNINLNRIATATLLDLFEDRMSVSDIKSVLSRATAMMENLHDDEDSPDIEVVEITNETETKVPRYTIIGGEPFHHHMNRGTTTFTAIGVIGTANTKEEAETLINDELFDQSGGLICIIDNTTGNIAEL